MKARLFISFLVLGAMFLLVPPLFSEGRAFDVSAVVENEYGQLVAVHGIYFDNAFFTLLYLFFGWFFICFPFVVADEVHMLFQKGSFIIGSWFSAILVYELLNWADPLKYYNSPTPNKTFGFYTLAFLLSLFLIIIHNKWTKLVKP